MAFLEVTGVSKTFRLGWLRRREIQAVAGVEFHLERGEILFLMGPNGSGKSTLLRMLATLIIPSTGRILLDGREPLDCRNAGSIAWVTNDDRSFFWRMTCLENLRFFCILNNLSEAILQREIARLAERLRIGDYLHRRYDQCSTGIKRRLAIARALLSSPALLLLDEPTSSLDADSAQIVRALVNEEVAIRRSAVVYISHQESELQAFSGARRAAMKDGRLTC